MVPVSTFTDPITSAPPFGGAFFLPVLYDLPSLSALTSPFPSPANEKGPSSGAELRPKSREETPHNGVPAIWACNPPMPIKFEVKRIIATSPASPRVINVLKNSGRLGAPGFQHPTMEIIRRQAS